jgi:protein tyrosine/serine phosphatase
MRLRRFLALMMAAAGLVLSTLAAPRGVPASEGVLNFGKVTDMVFRGAQPDEKAIKHLKELGIKSIIDLRWSGKATKAEFAMASTSGIICTNIPLSGASRPSEEQVRMVLAAIESLPGPVFIHCQHGCDRTGTIVACYRIKHDGWSSEKALAEARQYGLSKLEVGMKHFVLDFGKAAKDNHATVAKQL